MFSLANLRSILPRIQVIADELVERLQDDLPTNGGALDFDAVHPPRSSILTDAREIDILPWLGKGTIEYVGRGILGVNFDSLEPAKTNQYTDTIRNVQYVCPHTSILPSSCVSRLRHTAIKVLLLRPFVPWAARNLSLHWRNKLLDWLPFPALRELREIAHTMHHSANEIYVKKKAEVELGSVDDGPARDLMSIMSTHEVTASSFVRC